MRLKEEKMKEKLAINGGIPVRTEPFPPRIMFNEEEKKAVAKLMEKASYEATASALDRYADEARLTFTKKNLPAISK